jgi:hypothetical protein
MKLPKFMRGCEDNTLPPGLKAIIHLACTCDVQQANLRTQTELRALSVFPSGLPALPTTENKLSERVTVGEPILFVGTGTGFTAYEIVVHSGSYTSKTTGEVQFLAFTNETMFSIVGTDAEVRGFSDMVLNRGLICLVGDIGGVNDYAIFGMKDLPAFVAEVDIQSGAKPGDKRVATFKVQDMSGKSLKVYPVGLLHPSGLPLAT